jgi:hypothetical protein
MTRGPHRSPPLKSAQVDAASVDDPINHPSHYTAGGVEVIDAIEAWELNFRLANVVKYVARADRKGNPLDDLRKARWYLEREIQKRAPPGRADQ